MNKILDTLALLVLGICLNGFLEAYHHNLWNQLYDSCKAKLLAEDNFQHDQQIYDCVNSNTTIKILGTLLFKDGSVL